MVDKSEGDQTPPKRKRKPSSESKKADRLKTIGDKEPDFIGKAELARHLSCHINSIDVWVRKGRIPPPHSMPGDKHSIWLRKHYREYVRTGRWPEAAFRRRADVNSQP
jgi:hypothetical protein